ncbi:MAG: response regulator [Alphaproteobacteria bacterium]
MPDASQNDRKMAPRKLRVLVVDDNQTLAETLGWMVEAIGHVVQVVHNGIDALPAARSFRPDVVLLDIGLSGMNGYEICQKMRAEPEFKNCIIAAQTGWDNPEDHERSKAAGFDHHFVKPVPMDILEKLFLSLALPVSD